MSRSSAVVTTLALALILCVISLAGGAIASAAPQQPGESTFVYVSANRVMEYDAAAETSAELQYIDAGDPLMPSRSLNGASVSWTLRFFSMTSKTIVSETFTHPGQETTHALSADLYTFPRLSPDGTKLLYIVEGEDPGGGTTTYLHVWQVADDTELFSIPNVDSADWSADGTKIVFASYPRARFDPGHVTLYAYDLATEAETKLPAGHLTVVGEVNTYSPRCSPSGEWIAFQRYDYDQQTMDVVLTDPTGTAEQVLATLPLSRYGMGMEWVRMPGGAERLFLESVEAGGAPYLVVELPGPDPGFGQTRVLHAAFYGQAPGYFSDVSEQHAFYRQVRDLASLRVIGGYEDGSFKPSAPVKRAQYAKMISIALGVHDTAWTNWADPTFPDVPRPASQNDESRYPFDYVEEAATAGLVKGTTAGNFNPWAEISRVQLALMIARAGGDRLDAATGADYSVFTDLTGLSQEARDAIALVYHNAIINGKTATTFAPYASATRGQAAAMTWRLMKQLGMVD